MKTRIKNLFLLPALIAGLGLMLAGRAAAQTFTNLHSFTGGSDGASPQAGLILSGNTLYGTAVNGGSSSNGTVFAVNINGMGFTNLYSFTVLISGTNSDGANPHAGLILSGNTLYGTAAGGGISGNGTIFRLNTDGSGFTNLYSFTGGNDGSHPYASLILSGNILYGTAVNGGISGNGTVFAINTNGTGFTNLYSFTETSAYYNNFYTNSDGAYPHGLILSGNTLYGTASGGGISGDGTLFRLNTDGADFTNLYSFTATEGHPVSVPIGPNSDGANPVVGLILSGNTLYGTAVNGGWGSLGTVFAVNTDGTDFTNLHSFNGSDGANPSASLILSGNILYGTAQANPNYGGGVIVISNGVAVPQTSFAGTVFAINPAGMGFTNLYNFTEVSVSSPYTNSDGANPEAGLILSGNTLYGTASAGGNSGSGTIFSLFIPPQLTIIPSGTNVVLSWPTNATGFTLQFNTNLVSSAGWNAVSPVPVVINGQNTVTNPISGAQRFYRLSQ